MNTGKGLISEQLNGYSSCGPGVPLTYLLTQSPSTVILPLAAVLQDLRGKAALRSHACKQALPALPRNKPWKRIPRQGTPRHSTAGFRMRLEFDSWALVNVVLAPMLPDGPAHW